MAIEADNIEYKVTANADQAFSVLAQFEQKITQAQKEKTINLQLNIAEAQGKIADLRKQITQFRKDGDKDAEIKARVNIQDAQRNITQFRGEIKKIDGEVKSAMKATEEGARSASNSFLGLTRVGQDFLKLFTARQAFRFFQDIATGATQAAIGFNSGFTGVIKTVDGTQEQLAVLEQRFIQLSRTIPIAIEEILRIGEIGGQLGISIENLDGFTDTVARIAVATNLTAEEAAISFARIATVVGLPEDQIDQLGAAVVDLGNNFATTERELLDFTNRISGAGAVVGASASDLAAIGTAFTSVGVQAEAGGTAVQRTFFALNDAVSKGGDELNQFANFLGITANEFSKLFKDDPTEILVRFTEQLGKAGDEGSRILGELVSTDVRIQRAFLSMAAAGGQLRSAVELSSRAFEQNTALIQESELRFGTYESQIQQTRNTIAEVNRAIGDSLLAVWIPLRRVFADFLSDLVLGTDKLGAFGSVMKTVVIGSLGILAALLTVLAVNAGKAIISTLGLGAAFTTAARGADGATVSTSRFTLAVRGLLGAVTSLGGVLTIALTALTFFVAKQIEAEAQARRYKLAIAGVSDAVNTLQERFGGSSSQQAFDRFKDNLDALLVTQRELDSFIAKRGAEVFLGFDDDGSIFENIKQGFSGLNNQVLEFDSTIEEFAGSIGLTKQQLLEAVPGLNEFEQATFNMNGGVGGLRAGLSALSEEGIQKIITDIGGLSSETEKSLNSFNKYFNNLKSTGVDSIEAFSKALQRVTKDFSEIETDAFTNTILNSLYEQATEFKSVGELYALEVARGTEATEVTQRLAEAGIFMSGQTTGAFLKQAVEAQAAGAAYGLLLKLGIDDTRVANAQTAEELRELVLFNLTNPGAYASASARAFASARTVIGGIVSGIQSLIPSLSSVVNNALNIINKLTGTKAGSAVFGGFVSGLNRGVTALKGFANQAQETRDAALEAFEVQNFQSGGGGGGGGKGKDPKAEAERLKKEAEAAKKEREKEEAELLKQRRTEEEQAFIQQRLRLKINQRIRNDAKETAKEVIKSYEEEVEKVVELLEDVTDRTKDFYEDLNDSIKDTIASQVQLRREFESQQTALRGSFVEDVAQRFLDVEEERNELANEYNEIVANAKKIEDWEKANEIQTKLQVLEKERVEIQELRLTLLGEEQNAINSIIQREQERAKLSDTGRLLYDYKSQAQQLEEDFNKAYEQQQRFIDAQERVKELMAGDWQDKKLLAQLASLANLDLRTDQGAVDAKLEELGFGGLTPEQVETLFEQVTTARSLQAETSQILAQQKEILGIREEYMKAVETAFNTSIKAQREQVDGLIALIREAINEMNTLNSLSASGGMSTTGSTAGNSIVNNMNINNPVDLESYFRKQAQLITP